VGTQDPIKQLHVLVSGTSGTPASTADTIAVFQKSGGGESGAIEILANSGGNSTVYFGNEGSASSGSVQYLHASDSIQLGTNGVLNQLVINSAGAATVNGALTANTINTGFGNFEINQDLQTTASPTFVTVSAAVAGNATTATALAANGANCSSTNFALGVNASGVGECGRVDPAAVSGSTSPVASGALFTHSALTGTSAHAGSATATNNSIAVRDATAGLAASALSLTATNIAGLSGATPGAAGIVRYCSDCANSVRIVISTGTAIADWYGVGPNIQWH